MKLAIAICGTKIENLSTVRSITVFWIIRLQAALLPLFISRYCRLCYGALAFCTVFVISGCASSVQPSAAEASQVETVIPAGPMDIHVDHAWVKDASSPSQQDIHRKTMAALREKIEVGGSFVASWNTLGADGTYWHVAEKETYSSDVIPEGARNLPVGSLSAILPGDGGLHLFRILGREPVK
ncbi:MAG: hypothetical protein IPN42_16845 [Methylococcaceae bacterium]|nr:hypothetical protein [Methylococcaceae bacterium]